MELETVNKLYLELSQVATATTARELRLELAFAAALRLLDGLNDTIDRADARHQEIFCALRALLSNPHSHSDATNTDEG